MGNKSSNSAGPAPSSVATEPEPVKSANSDATAGDIDPYSGVTSDVNIDAAFDDASDSADRDSQAAKEARAAFQRAREEERIKRKEAQMKLFAEKRTAFNENLLACSIYKPEMAIKALPGYASCSVC